MNLWYKLFILAFCTLPLIGTAQESLNNWAIAHAEKHGFESVLMVTTYNDSALKKEKSLFRLGDKTAQLVNNVIVGEQFSIQLKDTLREYDQEKQLMRQLFYDVKLQALTKSVFLKDELISQQFDYYDQKGRLIRSLEKMPYLEKESHWEFDQKGRKKAFKQSIKDTFEGNKYQSWEKYIYTKDGRLRQVNHLNEQGHIVGYIRYQYDSRGFLKTADRYQANKLFAHTQYFYE